MTALSCVNTHFDPKSPLAAYRAEMVGDVAELMADGMDADTAWLQVATAKITELKTERARIEKVVADAYDQAQGVEKKPAAEVPAPVATHKDPGEPAEPVTPAVVAEAIKTGVQATDRKPSEMKAELLAKIDAAMPNAKGADDQDVQRYEERGRAKPDRAALMRKYGRSGRELDTAIASVQQKIDSERAKAAENIGTVTFKVPGDGEFTVVNTKERLAEFRRKVESSPGFKDRQPRQALEDAGDGAQRGSGGRLAAFENMVDEGDMRAALDFAAAVGIDPKTAKLTDVLRKRLDKWMRDAEMGAAVAAREEAQAPATPAPEAQEPAPADEDMRGYAWALVKNGRVVRSGSLPSPEFSPASADTKMSYYKDMADKEGAELYVGGYPGAAAWAPQDGLIFGMTWAELIARQQRGGQGQRIPEGKMPKDAVLAYSPKAAPAPESQAPAEPAKAKPGAVENFGEALPPARRAMAAKLDETLADSDIANRPLSEIWPLSENDAIEDTFAAAVAHAARAEVPAKPRQPYKLKRWVEKVKTVRNLTAHVLSGRLNKERLMAEVNGPQPGLKDWAAKVMLLEQIPRDQWKRVGEVEERPNAFTYAASKPVPRPMLRLTIDDKPHYLNGDGTVNGNLAEIRALLEPAAPEKRMEFEVRGPNGGPYKINKKGDSQYRSLGTYKTVSDARDAIAEYNGLLAAWESVKASDNITERDLRSAENRPRAGKDWRGGKDVTPEQFQESFGFKGGEFGKWVQQGKGDKERQALLNGAYDALMDLAQIAGIPPRAISLNGTLGIAFGSRGNGWASAHFEPSNLVINLTKTRGAGALAHEWFHAADNYFSRMRRDGEESKFTGSQAEYRASNFITHKPEALMVPKSGSRYLSPMTRTRLEAEHERRKDKTDAYNPANWQPDPAHPLGVRPEVEQRFADLVQAINDSPMTKRAILLDGNKTGNGYWSQMLERAARSFESYVIARMHEDGYHNDFLVNVRKSVETGKNPERYPYLLPGEIKPVADAFGALFNTIQTRTDDAGNVAMFSQGRGMGISMRDAKAIKTNISAILPNAPEIILHESVEQAPEALQDEIRAQDAWNDVEAVYWNGEIHAFPKHMASVERAEFVIGRHEIRHHGMRTRYGNKLDAVLLDMHRKNASLREAAQGIKDTGRAGPKETVKAIEEALADMPVDMVERLTGFDRFVAAVRDWLRMMARRMRANGLPNVAAAIDPKDWTDRDVAAFVLKSERVSGAGSSGVVFSRAPATDTDAFREWFKDSKVVDDQGQPLVVYHGTNQSFDAFDPEQSREGDELVFVTPSPKVASDFAMFRTVWGGANVMPLYVSAKKVLTVHGKSRPIREVENAALVDGMRYGETIRDFAARSGYDAIHFKDVTDDVGPDMPPVADIYALLKSAQIKSATGNNGEFDGANPDIRFSRSAAVGVTTAQDLVNSKGGVFDFNRLGETKQDRIRTVTDGARPFWLGALTRDQIADMYGAEIPPVKDYDSLTRAMENERAKMAGDADELYNEWAKLDPDVNDRLARIMLDATVHQVHPDGAFNQTRENNEERKRVHGNISTQFKLLPKEAQAMYGKVRDFHLGTLTKLRDSLMDRVKRQVENGNARAAALTSIRMQFDKYLENGPYFPLSRFGDFLVVATRAEDGERVVASYETAGEQQGAARKLEADGFTVKRKTAKSYSRQTDGAAGKFIASVLGTVDALDMDDAMLSGTTANLKSQLLDDINQMFIQALPDLSYRKHFMHRKGTAGFSSDVMRGFASSAFHSASHIARLNHGDKMTFALQDAFKAIEASDSGDFNLHSQVLNELTKRHDAAMNPNTHPIAAMLNQVGFVMYLGLSPAAGLVNMLQTVMVTMPHLGARYGFGKANGSLAAAYKDILAAPVNAKNGWNAAQSSKLSAEERKVMSDLQDEGVIDLTQAHDLASATSLDTGNVARSKAAFAMSKAMKIVGWTFHIPEVMNRQVTALSAYRLEMEKSGDQDAAKEAAREAIKRTHFDYSASNRARFMQGNVARVLLQFKQYSQNMTYLLGRAAHQALKGESPEVRAIARRQLVATLGVTFGMAGTLGLPGLGGAMSLIGMMVGALDDDDKPWDWKVEFRNLAADTFGKEAGEVLAHGIPRALMPWDISNRVGMGDMWWRNNGQEGQNPREQFASDMQNILGPTAGTVLGLYTAADQMARGNWSKAVEGMVPKALRDPLKALREGTDGVTNYNGEPLMDVTGAEVAGRLLGFAPARASEMYEAKGAVKNAETALNEKRQNLLSRMVKARIEGDGTAVQDLQVDIQAFNERNPAFKITMDSIMKSLLAKRRNTAETQDGIRLPKGKDDLRAIGRFAEVE